MYLLVLNDSGLDLVDDIDVVEVIILILVRLRIGILSYLVVGMKRLRLCFIIFIVNKCLRRKFELDCF